MLAVFRRTKKKAAAWNALTAVLVLLFVAALAGLAWIVRSPLPKVNGMLELSGIQAPITIRRDERGIPHINASTERDLFFAQGFACAQDRLWQMDTLRRRAQGRLSEIAGLAALETDRYMRRLGFREAALADLHKLRGAARADLYAYASGVNAAMATHPLPLEFRLMRYRPEPWTPLDSISIAKLMAQRLDDQWAKPEILANLSERFGSTAAAALTETHVPKLEVYVPGYGPSPARTSKLVSLSWAHYQAPQERELGIGSNNWAVSGRLTTTGKPVLANDTHLAHSLPSTWWISQLHGAGFNVEGFEVPGLPGVILGHNERIAFGVTSADEPVQDLFVERFRTAGSDEYIANGHWLHALHRIERIEVKGQPDTMLDVLVTRHGAVIERHGTRALALAWTILREGGEIQALRDLDRAENWQQFRAATKNVTGPVLNFGYADIAGNIGYQDVGRVPNRRNGDGTLPVEGEDDRFAWQGDVPFDKMPHALNPGNGIMATANNNLTRTKLAAFADAPYRVHRIYELLSQSGLKTPEQIGEIQADVYDYPRAELAAATAHVLERSPNDMLRRIAQQLRAWDGNASADSEIPTFLSSEDDLLSFILLQPKLGNNLLARYRHDYHAITPLLRVIEGDDRLTHMGITRKSILDKIPSIALAASHSVTQKNQNGLNGLEMWGKVNAAIYDHPLGRFWPLDVLLSARRLPQSGNAFTIFAGRAKFGPSMRLVADLANWDNSSMLLTLGESGHYTDAHYEDQEEDFLRVRWAPTPFSDNAVAAHTKDTLVLKPKS